MYLKKIIVLNNKSCQKVDLDLEKDTPNTFIGQTDAGKSTIMKSIGLLIDEKSFPPNLGKEGQDATDISTTRLTNDDLNQILENLGLPHFEEEVSNSIVILGKFVIEKDDIDKESDQLSPHLKWTIENSNESEFFLLKLFNEEVPQGRYFLCTDDNEEKSQLWNLPQSILNGIVKELKIPERDITNENSVGKFKNIEKFRAVYKKLGTTKRWSVYTEYGKKDRTVFPSYLYIDWRTINLKDIEAMATDTMSTTISEYSDELKKQAITSSNIATEKLNSELTNEINDILSGLPSVTSIKAKVYFRIIENISEITVEKDTSDGGVSLESQGDGVKKQIGFAFMKLRALKALEEKHANKKYVWCFDEPEIHLYPPEQREFYDTIHQLSKGAFQTLISTHSTVFVDKSRINSIRRVQLVDKYTSLSACDSVDDVHSILGIRLSDFLFYDYFVVGEGECDQILIPHFYKLYFGRSMSEDYVQFVGLGGSKKRKSNMELFSQMLSDFKDPNDYVFYALDRDSGSSGENVYLIGTNDIEDSIDDKFWAQLVREKCDLDLSSSELTNLRAKLSLKQSGKYHKLLSDLVIAKDKEKHLPTKKECAFLLTEYMVRKDEIPRDIEKLFEGINRFRSL